MRVERIQVAGGGARGVEGVTAAGAPFELRARGAVVLAASAIQTPCLLRRSGVRHGPVGDGLAAHPGVSVTARFAEPVRAWRGATQGHEVTGYRGEGIKIEALGYDMAITALRLKTVGSALARDIAELSHWANWGAAIRAESNRLEIIVYDKECYQQRNKVERLFNKLKQFRRLATRYEKLTVHFLAFVLLALIVIMLR